MAKWAILSLMGKGHETFATLFQAYVGFSTGILTFSSVLSSTQKTTKLFSSDFYKNRSATQITKFLTLSALSLLTVLYPSSVYFKFYASIKNAPEDIIQEKPSSFIFCASLIGLILSSTLKTFSNIQEIFTLDFRRISDDSIKSNFLNAIINLLPFNKTSFDPNNLWEAIKIKAAISAISTNLSEVYYNESFRSSVITKIATILQLPFKSAAISFAIYSTLDIILSATQQNSSLKGAAITAIAGAVIGLIPTFFLQKHEWKKLSISYHKDEPSSFYFAKYVVALIQTTAVNIFPLVVLGSALGFTDKSLENLPGSPVLILSILYGISEVFPQSFYTYEQLNNIQLFISECWQKINGKISKKRQIQILDKIKEHFSPQEGNAHDEENTPLLGTRRITQYI